MMELPVEMIGEIISHLKVKDGLMLEYTCKYMRSVCKDMNNKKIEECEMIMCDRSDWLEFWGLRSPMCNYDVCRFCGYHRIENCFLCGVSKPGYSTSEHYSKLCKCVEKLFMLTGYDYAMDFFVVYKRRIFDVSGIEEFEMFI